MISNKCLQLSYVAISPFGTRVEYDRNLKHVLKNILWFPVGIVFCSVHLILGSVKYVALLGHGYFFVDFKMAQLALAPYGAHVTHY
eukprot:Awhi_evm2s15021